MFYLETLSTLAILLFCKCTNCIKKEFISSIGFKKRVCLSSDRKAVKKPKPEILIFMFVFINLGIPLLTIKAIVTFSRVDN